MNTERTSRLFAKFPEMICCQMNLNMQSDFRSHTTIVNHASKNNKKGLHLMSNKKNITIHGVSLSLYPHPVAEKYE